jgi:hypothetical protein
MFKYKVGDILEGGRFVKDLLTLFGEEYTIGYLNHDGTVSNADNNLSRDFVEREWSLDHKYIKLITWNKEIEELINDN